jgi:hypothetical protein
MLATTLLCLIEGISNGDTLTADVASLGNTNRSK